MECPACLGTCEGSCSVCRGSCGSGMAMSSTEDELIALLEKNGGCGDCGSSDSPPGIEEVIIDHFKRGHTLEYLVEKEDGPKVVFNINSHGIWDPSMTTPKEIAKLNKQFLTFRFTTSGKLMAVRGRQFDRDVNVLLKRVKSYQHRHNM